MKKVRKRISDFVLQLIFPLHCPVCDRIVVPFGEKICRECLLKLKVLTPPWCMKCGKKLQAEGEFCADCEKGKHKYLRGRALYEYDSVSATIYRLKYGKRQEYADFLGGEMAYYLSAFLQDCKPDALVPVPLHRSRQNRRGYNQALLLAEAIGKYSGIPVCNNLLIRTRNTRPLKYQNPSERQNNLKKAFNIAQNDVKLNTIILVDDIYTTGSTINEITQVLLEHGVKNVYFVALACGKGV